MSKIDSCCSWLGEMFLGLSETNCNPTCFNPPATGTTSGSSPVGFGQQAAMFFSQPFMGVGRGGSIDAAQAGIPMNVVGSGIQFPYAQPQQVVPNISVQSVAQTTYACNANGTDFRQPPPPPPAAVGTGGAASVDNAVKEAESVYLKYYYETVIYAGATVEVAIAQAREAIAKLHEIGYFKCLRDEYMKRMNVHSSVEGIGINSLHASSSALSSHDSQQHSSTSLGTQMQPVSLHGTDCNSSLTAASAGRPGGTSLFQLKLHSSQFQTSSTAAVQGVCHVFSEANTFRAAEGKSTAPRVRKSRFDQKPDSPPNESSANASLSGPGGDGQSNSVANLQNTEMQTWIMRTYQQHAKGGPLWMKQVNDYIKDIVEQQRFGRLPNVDWKTEPLPSEEKIKLARIRADSNIFHLRDGNNGARFAASNRDNGSIRSAYGSDSCSPSSESLAARTTNNKRRLSTSRRGECSNEEIDVDPYCSEPSEVDGGGAPARWSFVHNKQETEEEAGDYISLARRKGARNKLRLRGSHRGRGMINRGGRQTGKDIECLGGLRLSLEEQTKRTQRMERFTGNAAAKLSDRPGEQEQTCNVFVESGNETRITPLKWQEKLELAKSTAKLVGLSSALEKPFLRLCGAPDPITVRPESVLRESFKLVMNKWKTERNWRYCEEQFRSIRQDMTVQGVKDEFALEVYESNGRIALENHDLGQFNQCQAQLPELYRILNVPSLRSNRVEFSCYRLLYLALQNMRLDLLRAVGELTLEEKAAPSIKYAMNIRRALADGNYHRYFKLCKEAPFRSRFLLDMFAGRMRIMSLITMTQAYNRLAPEFLEEELNFDGRQNCIAFLNSEKCVWSADFKYVDAKASYPVFSASPLLKSRKVKALG